MIFQTASLICAEWGVAVKTALIVIVSAVLLAVIAMLVAEAVGKRDNAPVAVEPDKTGSTEPEEVPAPEEQSEEQQPEEQPEQSEEEAPTEEEQQTEEELGIVFGEETEIAASDDETDDEEEADVEMDDVATIEDDDGAESGTMVVGERRIKVTYDRSFTAMLVQADDTVKGFYNELKNEILCYKMKQRMSWSNESWYISRKTYAKFGIRGKTLSLYLALDPKDFADTKYSFKDVGETAKYRDVPMQLKIKSERAAKWAKELLAAMAEKNGLARTDMAAQNFRPDYKDTKTLVGEKLIKLHYVASPDMSRQELETAAAEDLRLRDRAPRDFTTKLERADSETKAWYSAIKNELLRYGMKPRMSTTCESWYKGRTTYAKFTIRGKTLSLYMALDPKEFEGTKYNFRSAAGVGKYETVPMRVNLRSERAVRWVKELIATMAEKKGWQRVERTEEDFRYVKKPKKKK